MLYYEPPRSIHRGKLSLFLTALRSKLNGMKSADLIVENFNQIVHEAKIVCEDPMNATGFDPQSYYLAGCMLDFENLNQKIMQINTFDDVDEEISNRILLRLEPAYARSK